jgi:trigger factor
MKVQLKDDQGLYKELTLQFEREEFADKLEEIYSYLAHTVNLPGFRKGKIPKKVLRKRVKGEVERLLANALLEEYLEKALQEAGVKPVADIFLTGVELPEDESKFTLKVKFEVAPEFEVKNPEEITVEIPKAEFSQEQVERYIEELREKNVEWKDVDREIREGDLVEVEYEITETKSGETEKGETAAVVGEGLFRKEIEEAIKGKKAGTEIELKELPIYDQEGKEIGKVNIKLKIKAVKEKVLPELNDEFAKKLGLGETWEEARKKIEEQLREQFERSVEALKRERLLAKLVEEHKIEVPETLVRRELDNLVRLRLNELQQLGINPNTVNQQQLVQDLLPMAVFNVASRLILDKYAEKFGVEVSDEEVKEELKKLAQIYRVSPEEFERVAKEQGIWDSVKADLRRNKVLEELAKKVKFVEVEPEEGEKKSAEGGEENKEENKEQQS